MGGAATRFIEGTAKGYLPVARQRTQLVQPGCCGNHNGAVLLRPCSAHFYQVVAAERTRKSGVGE